MAQAVMQLFQYNSGRYKLLVGAETLDQANMKLIHYLNLHQHMPQLNDWRYIRPLGRVSDDVFTLES
jgi:hypothetical protein